MARLLVVGTGLAGIGAALEASRLGYEVAMVEAHKTLGGRGTSTTEEGWILDAGPHFLDLTGEIKQWLDKSSKVKLATRRINGKRLQIIRDGTLQEILASPEAIKAHQIKGTDKKRLLSASRYLSSELKNNPNLNAEVWIKGESQPFIDYIECLTILNTWNQNLLPSSFPTIINSMKGKSLHVPLGGWAEVTGRFFSALDVLEVQVRSNSPLKRLVKDSSGKLRGAVLNGSVKVEADAIVLAVPFASVETILETSRMQVPAYENKPLKVIVWDLQLSMKAFEGVHAIWDSDRKVALIMMSNIVPERLPEDCREEHSHLSFLSYNDKQSIELFLDERVQGWRKNIVNERCLEDVVISQSTAEEKEFEQPYLQQGLAFAGDWINGEGWLSERAFKSGVAAVQALHESL